MLKIRLCELLGLDVPIILAPMGTCTSAELAAAVSNEGGLGGIGSLFRPTGAVKRDIDVVKTLTNRAFAINHIPQCLVWAALTPLKRLLNYSNACSNNCRSGVRFEPASQIVRGPTPLSANAEAPQRSCSTLSNSSGWAPVMGRRCCRGGCCRCPRAAATSPAY